MDPTLHNQPLDYRTVATLETSLGMKVLKLLAIVTMADQVVTEEEREFVQEFWNRQYPPQIADHFNKRFEEYLNEPPDLKSTVSTINTQMSYQEKVFCVFKLFELMNTDKADPKEKELIQGIAGELNLHPGDVDFLTGVFDPAEGDRQSNDVGTGIIQLKVNDRPSDCDIFLPVSGLDLNIYKIYDLFCLIQSPNDPNPVFVDQVEVRKGALHRIPHNARIVIDKHVIKYPDLNVFFENKVHPLHTDLFLRKRDGAYTWDPQFDDDRTMRLSMEGSRLRLFSLHDELICNINNTEVCGFGEVYVNLDDSVMIKNHRFNLREVFFHLNREKVFPFPTEPDEFLITNDARGDLFIADSFTDHWEVRIIHRNGGYFMDPGTCPHRIRMGAQSMEGEHELQPGRPIFIHNRFLLFDVNRQEVRQTLFSFEKLKVRDIGYNFSDGSSGLNHISFEVSPGELACIIGPSGSGKSTLLSLLSGFLRPSQGQVVLGEHDLHQNFENLKNYLGFVPQDDLLFSRLTVYENLFYYAKLRYPERNRRELDRRIDQVLNDVGLFEKKHSIVGSPVQKILSGGERKRLNIGLELLADAEVFFLDEPTSGLSSKDSEKIIELLANIAARGKIVLAVIHQPGLHLYSMFDKVVLMDNGGYLAFFGNTRSALRYFQDQTGKAPPDLMGPDLLLDSLEKSLLDVDGARLSERTYTPEYWQEKYRLFRKEREPVAVNMPGREQDLPHKALTWKDRLVHLLTLICRGFRGKLRDRSNLTITFLGAPLIGWIVGLVTRFEPDRYWLYNNDLLEFFLFTAIIFSLFFGMTNSVDEIISQRAMFLRERLLNVKPLAYIGAQLFVLMVFSVIQNALYLGVGFHVLQVKELFIPHVAFLSLVSLCGLSLGLFISAIPNISSKAAQNLIPIILIPQLILGGALIDFEKMSKKIRFSKDSPVPEICQMVFSRWAYEGMMVLQSDFNRFDAKYDRLGSELNELKRKRLTRTQEKNIIQEFGKEYYEDKKALKEKRIEEMDKYRNEFMTRVGLRYGNAFIRNKVARTNAAYSLNPTDEYPMLISRKTLPLLRVELTTVIYNGISLLGFVLFFLGGAWTMLKYRDYILDTAMHIRKRFKE